MVDGEHPCSKNTCSSVAVFGKCWADDYRRSPFCTVFVAPRSQWCTLSDILSVSNASHVRWRTSIRYDAFFRMISLSRVPHITVVTCVSTWMQRMTNSRSGRMVLCNGPFCRETLRVLSSWSGGMSRQYCTTPPLTVLRNVLHCDC